MEALTEHRVSLLLYGYLYVYQLYFNDVPLSLPGTCLRWPTDRPLSTYRVRLTSVRSVTRISRDRRPIALEIKLMPQTH